MEFVCYNCSERHIVTGYSLSYDTLENYNKNKKNANNRPHPTANKI